MVLFLEGFVLGLLELGDESVLGEELGDGGFGGEELLDFGVAFEEGEGVKRHLESTSPYY